MDRIKSAFETQHRECYGYYRTFGDSHFIDPLLLLSQDRYQFARLPDALPWNLPHVPESMTIGQMNSHLIRAYLNREEITAEGSWIMTLFIRSLLGKGREADSFEIRSHLKTIIDYSIHRNMAVSIGELRMISKVIEDLPPTCHLNLRIEGITLRETARLHPEIKDWSVRRVWKNNTVTADSPERDIISFISKNRANLWETFGEEGMMVIASRGLLHHAKSAKSAIKYILSIERHLPEDVREEIIACCEKIFQRTGIDPDVFEVMDGNHPEIVDRVPLLVLFAFLSGKIAISEERLSNLDSFITPENLHTSKGVPRYTPLLMKGMMTEKMTRAAEEFIKMPR